MINPYNAPFLLSGAAGMTGLLCMAFSIQGNWPFWYFWCGIIVLLLGIVLAVAAQPRSQTTKQAIDRTDTLEYYVIREKLEEPR